jgi:hypothetical protein
MEYQEHHDNEETLVQSWQDQHLNVREIFNREDELRVSFNRFLDELDRLITGTDREAAALRGYTLAPADQAARYIDETRTVQAELRTLMIGDEARFTIGRYTMANGDMGQRLANRQEEFVRAENYIQGTPSQDTDAAGALAPGSYPAEGLELLTRMGETLDADIETSRFFLSRYDEERRDVSALPEMAVLRSATRGSVDDLNSLRARGQTLAAAARTRVAQAESLRLEGDRYFREAQSAAAANNLDTAQDRLERSAERYTASLSLQESASLRADWDTRAVALGADIHRRENETAVREVRSMVNAARNNYFSGDFDQAEDLLVRAQNRWQANNAEDDVEIVYWLSIVRGALALRTDRVLPATAPLYPEMSQLISDATRHYEDGVRLINTGNRSDGLSRFADARYMIQKVKLMFPVNQDAGLLELRIDQVIDPTAFNASFQRRLNDAIGGTRRRSIESFADLQNLAELNPRYPGIQQALDQAEIDMGRRQAPPDPRTLARSNELTVAARRIVDGNARLQFEVALRQLNEALTLNPNNTQAMSLKDRVQTEMGGSGNIVLSSAAEGEYQRAVRELQQGNTLVALAIVEQLLQDSRNRGSTRIIELERRIHSVL